MKHPRQNKLLALSSVLLLISVGMAILGQKAGAAADSQANALLTQARADGLAALPLT